MKVALEQFSSERTTDLAKYYYNVFLPRRLASLNRTEATNFIDASPDDEGNNQDDDNKVHRSEEKSKALDRLPKGSNITYALKTILLCAT